MDTCPWVYQISSMTAETMAFADTFDAPVSLKSDLASILVKTLPLLILTDSKPLFEFMACSKYTKEKRLMIYISAAREGFNRHDITKIRPISSEDKIAESMTKISSNNALHHLLLHYTISRNILQYVV
jgi:hypothetical protein